VANHDQRHLHCSCPPECPSVRHAVRQHVQLEMAAITHCNLYAIRWQHSTCSGMPHSTWPVGDFHTPNEATCRTNSQCIVESWCKVISTVSLKALCSNSICTSLLQKLHTCWLRGLCHTMSCHSCPPVWFLRDVVATNEPQSPLPASHRMPKPRIAGASARGSSSALQTATNIVCILSHADAHVGPARRSKRLDRPS
jgi:hypothetical protein